MGAFWVGGVRLKFDLKTDLHEVWHTDIVRRRIEMICKADAVESGRFIDRPWHPRNIGRH
jgi:hypothetical protein